ncbi:MAG: inositol monophosphatase family protein [Candidatus Tyrphobacter sp.]
MTSDPIADALDVAAEAGALLLAHLHEPLAIREKERRADIVTLADSQSERLIVSRLRAKYPAATILTEEAGVHEGTSQERWIVDPLDGTTNFAHSYPLWNVSIAYERDGAIVAGVVYAPAMNECFAAERGAGARVGKTPIRVSEIAHLGAALTCTGFHPADFARNGKEFAAVSDRAQAVRRDGAAALDLAYVACGRFDGFWEFDLHAWDVAAGSLIIAEAGGCVTCADGSPLDIFAGSILGTNGRIHEELKSVLRRAR